MKEQNKSNAIPLVLQSFGLGSQQTPSNYNSRIRSSPKPPEEKNHRSYDYEENSRLVSQTSRKKIQLEERGITEHYENMEKILLNENLNLKQQNSYLTSEVRKALRREEKAKEQQKSLQAKLKRTADEYRILQSQYLALKAFIEKQLTYLSGGINSKNFYELKNMVWRYIDEVSAQLSINIDQYFSYSEGLISREKPSNQQTPSEIDNEIEFLTKRLEKLINEEHSASKGPAVRRECIQISKQLKQLKEQSRTIASQISCTNQPSDIKSDFASRPSRSFEKVVSREKNPMKKQFLRSESIQEELPAEGKRYSGDIGSKLVRRKTLNKESKFNSSRQDFSVVVSPPGSEHRVQ